MKLLVTGVLLLLTTLTFARHPASVAAAQAKIQTDGSYELKVRFDLLAYCLDIPPSEVADGPMNALLDGPRSELEASLAAAKQKFRTSLAILGNGAQANVDSYTFPTADEVLRAVSQGGPRLPVILVARATGHLPTKAAKSTFRFPESLGTVVLTTEFPYEEPVSEPVEPGSESTALTLPTAAQVNQAQASMQTRAAQSQPKPTLPKVAQRVELKKESAIVAQASSLYPKPTPQFTKPDPKPTDPLADNATKPQPVPPPIENQRLPWYAVLPRYVRMGFVHILPQGLDHILFVLGLFLLSTRTKDLLKQITAFTVAHSLTLALSLYGVVRLPASIVEPVIALSIVFVAVENLCTTKMHKWRIGVVFLFGLVHGLGFARVLQDAGLARNDFLTALLGFNFGVELGQLSVVAGALLLVGWFRSHARYRPLVAVPASLAIALVAAVWTVERIL